MTNAEVNRIIAECVGDEGFWPAETCRDHQNRIPEFKGYGHIGEPCLKCGAIIQRGEPKDFCGSLDLTVGVVQKGYSDSVEHLQWECHWSNYSGSYEADVWHSSQTMPIVETKSYKTGRTAAEALAHAYAQVLVAAKGEGNG